MSIISKPYTFTAGQTIIAAEHNANFDTLYNDYNGNITDANISSSAAIADSKLASISSAGKIMGSSLSSLSTVSSTAGGFPWANMPPGMPLAYPGASAPTGCIALDGSTVSRTVYAILFALYGTTYGAGDASTTFNLPDMRGRLIAGYKSADGNFGTIGGTGGAITVDSSHAHNVSRDGWGESDQVTHTGRLKVRADNNFNAANDITSGTGGSTTLSILQPYMTWLWICSTGGQ